MEIMEEKNDITKVIGVVRMKVQPAKERPAKSLEVNQEEYHDPTMVVFRKNHTKEALKTRVIQMIRKTNKN